MDSRRNTHFSPSYLSPALLQTLRRSVRILPRVNRGDRGWSVFTLVRPVKQSFLNRSHRQGCSFSRPRFHSLPLTANDNFSSLLLLHVHFMKECTTKICCPQFFCHIFCYFLDLSKGILFLLFKKIFLGWCKIWVVKFTRA